MRRAIVFLLVMVLFAVLSASLSHALFSTTGYWRFEEGTANAVASGANSILDSSGSGDHGTPFGTPIYRADVPVNPIPQTGATNNLSMEFDSPDDKIVINSVFPFNQPGAAATLEFWFKRTAPGHYAIFWGRSDSSDINRFHFYVNFDNTIGFDYRPPGGGLHVIFGSGGPSGGIPVSNPFDWTHIAITRTGNDYSLYINGALAATTTDAFPDLPTSVGWSLSGRAGFEYPGFVDEVRISNVALQPDQFLLNPGVLTVTIDIKPGSFPNSINPRSNGVIPVAILTTSAFDATTVDPMNVRFGPNAAPEAHGRGHIEDADGDGDLDLVLHFRTQSTGIVCGNTTASLTGNTFGGQAISGSDSINTVGCN